jgi:hypothetical protein
MPKLVLYFNIIINSKYNFHQDEIEMKISQDESGVYDKAISPTVIVLIQTHFIIYCIIL